jgi:hypothetical protein
MPIVGGTLPFASGETVSDVVSVVLTESGQRAAIAHRRVK